jgi:hypothetical protein
LGGGVRGSTRDLAPRYGFGFVDRWEKISRKFWPEGQAGAYLSSYFVRGVGHKAPITENVLARDLPRLVVYIDRELTLRTGCTMRNPTERAACLGVAQWAHPRPGS